MSGPAFVEVRGGDTAARYGESFRRTELTADGGELVDIVPSSP